MKFSTLADRTLRIVAAVTAIAFLFVVLIVGIMANDAGNAKGAKMSALVWGVGGLLVLWVLICSITPSLVTERLSSRPVLRFALVSLPSYVFGLAGLAWCASYGYSAYRLALRSNPNVAIGNSEYPVSNPRPSHTLEVKGALPSSLPVGDFLAIYATDLVSGTKISGPCQLLNDSGPQEFWSVEPRVKQDSVPLVRSNDRYHATFVIDLYLPGRCNWHLKEIRYRLFAPGHGYRDSIGAVGQIEVFDDRHSPVDLPAREKIYRGRADVWCLEARNKAVTPYYPEACGDWGKYNFRASPSLRASVRPEETEFHPVVTALPDTVSIELNFHDLDALPATAAAPSAQQQ
jgi:hypothetical protein